MTGEAAQTPARTGRWGGVVQSDDSRQKKIPAALGETPWWNKPVAWHHLTSLQIFSACSELDIPDLARHRIYALRNVPKLATILKKTSHSLFFNFHVVNISLKNCKGIRKRSSHSYIRTHRNLIFHWIEFMTFCRAKKVLEVTLQLLPISILVHGFFKALVLDVFSTIKNYVSKREDPFWVSVKSS